MNRQNGMLDCSTQKEEELMLVINEQRKSKAIRKRSKRGEKRERERERERRKRRKGRKRREKQEKTLVFMQNI